MLMTKKNSDPPSAACFCNVLIKTRMRGIWSNNIFPKKRFLRNLDNAPRPARKIILALVRAYPIGCNHLHQSAFRLDLSKEILSLEETHIVCNIFRRQQWEWKCNLFVVLQIAFATDEKRGRICFGPAAGHVEFDIFGQCCAVTAW